MAKRLFPERPALARPLRVALFHNSKGGGAKRSVYNLAKGLMARSHTIDVFVPQTANETYLPLTSLGLQVRTFRRPACPTPAKLPSYLLTCCAHLAQAGVHFYRHASSERRIATVIDGQDYDVVWSDNCLCISAPFILRHLKTPSVYFCHEPYRKAYESEVNAGFNAAAGHPSWLKRTYFRGYLAACHAAIRMELASARRVDRSNARQASRMITNSKYTKRFIKQAYAAEALVNYLGVDTAVFHPMQLPRERLVLAVGAFHKGKRYDLTIKAIGQIPSARRPQMVLIGFGNASVAAQYEALARSCGVSFQIVRDVSDEELARWYNRASVVTYTAFKEPFGLVALEAMACGTPVVAVREGGLQESVEDGKTGFLVEPTPEAVAGAIQRVLDDPALQRSMGEAGVEVVRRQWTWDAATDRFERHLYEVAASRKVPA